MIKKKKMCLVNTHKIDPIYNSDHDENFKIGQDVFRERRQFLKAVPHMF
jgi:hypothetical protein